MSEACIARTIPESQRASLLGLGRVQLPARWSELSAPSRRSSSRRRVWFRQAIGSFADTVSPRKLGEPGLCRRVRDKLCPRIRSCEVSIAASCTACRSCTCQQHARSQSHIANLSCSVNNLNSSRPGSFRSHELSESCFRAWAVYAMPLPGSDRTPSPSQSHKTVLQLRAVPRSDAYSRTKDVSLACQQGWQAESKQTEQGPSGKNADDGSSMNVEPCVLTSCLCCSNLKLMLDLFPQMKQLKLLTQSLLQPLQQMPGESMAGAHLHGLAASS